MLSKLETRKDTIQEGVESAATHAGRIATIVAGAVRDVAREVGEFATDVFEMREAARRAEADQPEAEPVEPARRVEADQGETARLEPRT
jgi:hypothetical protein